MSKRNSRRNRARRPHFGELHESKQTRRSCGKIRYRNKGLAVQVRRELEGDGDELRIYGCPECGGFHLTSKLTARVRVPNREVPE